MALLDCFTGAGGLDLLITASCDGSDIVFTSNMPIFDTLDYLFIANDAMESIPYGDFVSRTSTRLELTDAIDLAAPYVGATFIDTDGETIGTWSGLIECP